MAGLVSYLADGHEVVVALAVAEPDVGHVAAGEEPLDDLPLPLPDEDGLDPPREPGSPGAGLELGPRDLGAEELAHELPHHDGGRGGDDDPRASQPRKTAQVSARTPAA